MELILNPRAEAARDRAKRAVPEGGVLDVTVLLAALYHGSRLKESQPDLGRFLPEPPDLRKKTPNRVPLSGALQGILTELARSTRGPLDPEMWFTMLAATEPGRACLLAAGASEDDLLKLQSLADHDDHQLRSPELDAENEPPSAGGWRTSAERRRVVEELGSYGRLLTAGDPLVKPMMEMEKPLLSLVRVLVKRKQRNAIVIGQPGTGKSAVVHELARRIVAGHESIPARLRDHDVFELSPVFLRSGAGVVGEYDKRVAALLGLLRDHPKVILFVDEIHALLQSGMHQRGPFSDANEAFKQAMGFGELTMIGCTTTGEYRHYIEADAALAQRFSIVKIDPPSSAATLAILHSRLPSLESYYKLRVPDAVLSRTVELTEQYLLGRAQPRKSIQLLDETCAYRLAAEPGAQEVTEADLWAALQETIGHAIVTRDTLHEDDLVRQLREKIIGQDEALRELARDVVSALGGWASRASGPRGVFLFGGPTGVGKTETALVLARILGGGRDALIRVNCNALHGSGLDAGPALNILLGPPPGYLGYVRGQGGELSRIRDLPQCVVLFDEIEKAHRGVGNLLLQIIDEGRCEDTEGNLLDFCRAFVIFTTNAGSVYDRTGIGFTTETQPQQEIPRTDAAAVQAALRAQGFDEAFLGRLRHTFVFAGLDRGAIRSILTVHLERLRATAAEHGYTLTWQDELLDDLAGRWRPRWGARHLLSLLDLVRREISIADAQGELAGVQRIRLEVLTKVGGAVGVTATGVMRERADDELIIWVA